MTSKATWHEHVEHAIRSAQKAVGALHHVFYSPHVTIELKRLVCMTVIRPILEHGSEVWQSIADGGIDFEAGELPIQGGLALARAVGGG